MSHPDCTKDIFLECPPEHGFTSGCKTIRGYDRTCCEQLHPHRRHPTHAAASPLPRAHIPLQSRKSELPSSPFVSATAPTFQLPVGDLLHTQKRTKTCIPEWLPVRSLKTSRQIVPSV